MSSSGRLNRHRQWRSTDETDNEKFVCLEGATCSNHAERNPHLVDKHNRENGLVEEPGFAAGGEKRQTKAGHKGHLSRLRPK